MKLGRPPEDIRGRGLRPQDFSGSLKLPFGDGPHATFHHAFFIHDGPEGATVVFTEHCFTEHCGHPVFPDWLRIVDETRNVLFNRLD